MDEKTARALNAINRAFYRESAAEFSATREQPWPGWAKLLALAQSQGQRPLAVLDVGCGNGRFAAFLDRALAERGETFRYFGVDASQALLERARVQRLSAAAADYRCADLVETPPERALPSGPFSLVVLFGILHHLPGAQRRRRLLQAAAGRLAPGGLLALTAWRFEVYRRFRDRIVAWEEYGRRAPSSIDPAKLEPGDHLLRWGDPARDRVRYCHFADEDEIGQLAAGLGLEQIAAYRADGREGDLNHYLVLRAGA